MESEAAEDRQARMPHARLLPLSLDVPLVPPKPEPRGLTMPRPFGLRSEVGAEEDLILRPCLCNASVHNESVFLPLQCLGIG